MAELLASVQDINAWLPDDKLEANLANTAKLQTEAWRLIRSQLASSFLPTTLAGWTTPANTPDLIRSIASRLIAAYLYRTAYSEDSVNIPPYAQELYNEAVAMLGQIRSGNLIVVDINDLPIDAGQQLMSNLDFWPNNTSDPPYFTMADKFG